MTTIIARRKLLAAFAGSGDVAARGTGDFAPPRRCPQEYPETGALSAIGEQRRSVYPHAVKLDNDVCLQLGVVHHKPRL
jgi:hypothetical protein